ncbi:hypothetical protein RQP46_007264 [Phenoliferia psychrophenolica]
MSADVHTLKQRGNNEFNKKEWTAAFDSYTQALSLDSKSDIASSLYANRSACCIHLFKFDLALLDANSAVALKPKWSKTYARRAEAYGHLQAFGLAITAYKRAVQLAEDDAARKRYLLAIESFRQKADKVAEHVAAKASNRIVRKEDDFWLRFAEEIIIAGCAKWKVARDKASDLCGTTFTFTFLRGLKVEILGHLERGFTRAKTDTERAAFPLSEIEKRAQEILEDLAAQPIAPREGIWHTAYQRIASANAHRSMSLVHYRAAVRAMVREAACEFLDSKLAAKAATSMLQAGKDLPEDHPDRWSFLYRALDLDLRAGGLSIQETFDRRAEAERSLASALVVFGPMRSIPEEYIFVNDMLTNAREWVEANPPHTLDAVLLPICRAYITDEEEAMGVDPLEALSIEFLTSLGKGEIAFSMRATRASSTQESSLERPEVPDILSCCRESPRPCINQALVDALQPIRMMRLLQYGSRSKEFISYATAISNIIGTPYRIISKEEGLRLNKASWHIGEKIVLPIDEFLRTGKIQEADDIAKSEEFLALKAFTTVEGIGSVTARELWAQGFRTLDDLRKHDRWRGSFKWMPREVVESVASFVKVQLDKVEPGAHVVLCGGYRRGKTESNDVDLLITYPWEDGKERGVLARLLDRLLAKGLIPNGGILSQSHAATNRTTHANKSASFLDSLDRAFVVFWHPPNGTTRPKGHFRRLDIIVTRWPSFGSAVVGWTGSTQFERDLRTRADQMGMKFDSGGLRRKADSAVVEAVMEEDVFRVLGLAWIPPELRNADP